MRVLHVATEEEGSYRAFAIMKKLVDKETLLLLSGGRSPTLLYELMASSVGFKPGSVALVDERFGPPFHAKSNEKMIKDTGLINYFETLGISFYRILTSRKSREKLARKYNRTMTLLFKKLPKKVAVMGIGEDGHTAGIAPNRGDFKNPLFKDKESFALSFNDAHGPYGARITLTFKALRKVDTFIIVAFGKEKRRALKMIFDPGVTDPTEVPAIVLRDLRAMLITDQKW